MSIGCRVFLRRDLSSRELLEKFKTISTANIADCIGHHNAMFSMLRRMTQPTAN